jgi:lipoprotein signal peptidase
VGVADRLLLLVAVAVPLACTDLIVKATFPTATWAFHHRSDAWLVFSVVLLMVLVALSFAPSPAMAVAAGLMSAGVIGNLVSAGADGNWVPDPLTITHGGYGLAFNLADVFFTVGNVILTAVLVTEAIRRRDRLAAPRGWERALFGRWLGP